MHGIYEGIRHPEIYLSRTIFGRSVILFRTKEYYRIYRYTWRMPHNLLSSERTEAKVRPFEALTTRGAGRALGCETKWRMPSFRE
jgi:hypothetical protein